MPRSFVCSSAALAVLTLVLAGAAAQKAQTQAKECQNGCPMYSAEDFKLRFNQRLRVSYAGQEDAIRSIMWALMGKLDTSANQATPLLLHFSGPTGVGKTWLSQLIGDALFADPCGTRKIPLDMALRSGQGQQERIDIIKRALIAQFTRCPRSVVILDDFQFAPIELIASLKEAFDESPTISYGTQSASTRQGIFILCSDLEEEQRHLTPDMTIIQARDKVKELAQLKWGHLKQGSTFGKLLAKTMLFPFTPLTNEELRTVVHLEFSKLNEPVREHVKNLENSTHGWTWRGRVSWNKKHVDARVLDHLATEINEFNARSIRILAETQLLPHARQISECLTYMSQRKTDRGYLWDAVDLLDDAEIVDIADNGRFTIHVGKGVCISGGDSSSGTGRPGGRGSEL